jgi:small subunit ribosomal protein S15
VQFQAREKKTSQTLVTTQGHVLHLHPLKNRKFSAIGKHITITYTSISMYLTSEKKQEIFKKHGKSDKDTGSAEGQIALFTFRISHLTEHLKVNKKDFGTQRSLIRLVGKRRSLLDYLQKTEIARYRAIVKELDLRK